ncbi:putative receptor-like protein kinase [Sesamum angolense]|uniref:Receptor-like protein kinase n=1 Tax=Sesamum angolense TaxID=2727404 RepID=A0AAE1WXW6_9LAMI|nr:putative receptor-like protein kinase [Sesamum angolense]
MIGGEGDRFLENARDHSGSVVVLMEFVGPFEYQCLLDAGRCVCECFLSCSWYKQPKKRESPSLCWYGDVVDCEKGACANWLVFPNLGRWFWFGLVMQDCVRLRLEGQRFVISATVAAPPCCSKQEDRGKMLSFNINALVAISVSRYANATSNLGVTSDLSDLCLRTISKTFQLYGVTRNATVFCGFGTKIPVKYECQVRSTVTHNAPVSKIPV